jgi:hypothetical protein
MWLLTEIIMTSPIREACETLKLAEGMIKAGEMYSDYKRKIPLDIIWRIYDWLKPIFDLGKDVGFFQDEKKIKIYLMSMKIEPNLPG